MCFVQSCRTLVRYCNEGNFFSSNMHKWWQYSVCICLFILALRLFVFYVKPFRSTRNLQIYRVVLFTCSMCCCCCLAAIATYSRPPTIEGFDSCIEDTNTQCPRNMPTFSVHDLSNFPNHLTMPSQNPPRTHPAPGIYVPYPPHSLCRHFRTSPAFSCWTTAFAA